MRAVLQNSMMPGTGSVAHGLAVISGKSLFMNILRISSMESRFCRPVSSSMRCNVRKINILSFDSTKKVWAASEELARNSLFFNILPAKYLESIFYRPKQEVNQFKYHKINNLKETIQEISLTD